MIGEAVASFIQQTYPNKKLIILDSHPQEIQWDRSLPSNIQYLKVKSHDFKDLSEKTHYALSLVKSELVYQQEDDDKTLPFALDRLVKAYVAEKSKNPVHPIRVGHTEHYATDGGLNGLPLKVGLYGNLCWARYAFEHRSGHWQNADGNPFDVKYMELPWQTVMLNYPEEVPGYLYSWNNCQHHFSGFYGQRPHDELYRYFEGEHSKQDISKIKVKVEWRNDYRAECANVLRAKGIVLPDYF